MQVKDQKFEPKAPDVIRTEVIDEYGFDPEDDADKERIDKLTNERIAVQDKQIEHHKKLSKAIAQKVKAKLQLESDDEDDDDTEDPKGTTDTTTPPADTSNFVTKEDLHRMKYPNLSDEEYGSISALAKATGKSFEDTIANNPIAKTYFESSEARQRLSNVIKAPSTRISPTETKSEEDKIADELSSNLPEGYSLPKQA